MTTTETLYNPNVTAANRLHFFRKRAAKQSGHDIPGDWRKARQFYRWTDHVNSGRVVFQTMGQALADNRLASQCDRKAFADDASHLPGRDAGSASDIVQRLPLGWYCDDAESETARGLVLQLPARGGRPIYYPAVDFSDRCGAIGWPLDWHTNPEDAAYAADSRAQELAEEARKRDQRFRADMTREDHQQEMANERAKVRALAQELRQLEASGRDLPPVICQTLRDRIGQARRYCHRLAARCAELRDEPWRIDA